MLTLALFSWAVTRRLCREPGQLQVAVEGALRVIDDTIRSVLPGHAERVFPFLPHYGSSSSPSNLIGLIPGIHAPTGDVSVTAGWLFSVS